MFWFMCGGTMKKLIVVAIFSSLFLSACSLKTVFVGGGFGTYDGQNATRLLHIAAFTGVKSPWFDPGGSINKQAYTSAVDLRGTRIYIGGRFTQFDGVAAGGIVAVDLLGKSMEGNQFNSAGGFNGNVYVIARDLHYPDENDQRYFVGGDFTTYQGLPAPGIIRILANGDIDPEFNPGVGVDYSPSSNPTSTATPNPARVLTVAFDVSRERTCFGGSFTSYRGLEVNNMVCLKKNGPLTSEPDFASHASPLKYPIFNKGGFGFAYVPESDSYEGEVDQIKFDENYDFIYVSGRFNRYNGAKVDHLVRLDLLGNLDMNYGIQTQGTKRARFILADTNAIITGGESYTVDTATGPETTIYNSLIKINRDDGALVPGFAVTPSTASDYTGSGGIGLGTAALIDGEVISPGKLYFSGGPAASVGGAFPLTLYNLQHHPRLLRIDKTTGAIDGDFNFSPDFGFASTNGAAQVNTLEAIETPFFD